MKTTSRLTHRNTDLSVSQQRNLNNVFAYDLVPSPSVITAALRAARRVNDFPTAVRVFEGAFPTSACWFSEDMLTSDIQVSKPK